MPRLRGRVVCLWKKHRRFAGQLPGSGKIVQMRFVSSRKFDMVFWDRRLIGDGLILVRCMFRGGIGGSITPPAAAKMIYLGQAARFEALCFVLGFSRRIGIVLERLCN